MNQSAPATVNFPLQSRDDQALVFVDPKRVVSTAMIRPLSRPNIDKIKLSMEINGYMTSFPVTGAFLEDESVHLHDGAHRLQAVLELIQEGNSKATSTLIPMVIRNAHCGSSGVHQSNHVFSSLVAISCNEASDIRQNTTFLDYVVIVQRFILAYICATRSNPSGLKWVFVLEWVKNNLPGNTALLQPFYGQQFFKVFSALRSLWQTKNGESFTDEEAVTVTNCPLDRRPLQALLVAGGRSDDLYQFKVGINERISTAESSKLLPVTVGMISPYFIRQGFGKKPPAKLWQEIEPHIESTPFTKTIYFMVLANLWRRVADKETREKCGSEVLFAEDVRVLSKQKYSEPVKRGTYFDGNGPEWIGIIISKVVKCWNKVALLAGFEDIEKLVEDVVLFDKTSCQYVTIPDGHGMAPTEQKNDLLHGKKCCEKAACTNEDKAWDSMRRAAAKSFFKHLFTSVFFFVPEFGEAPNLFDKYFLSDDLVAISGTDVQVPASLSSFVQKIGIPFFCKLGKNNEISAEGSLHDTASSEDEQDIFVGVQQFDIARSTNLDENDPPRPLCDQAIESENVNFCQRSPIRNNSDVAYDLAFKEVERNPSEFQLPLRLPLKRPCDPLSSLEKRSKAKSTDALKNSVPHISHEQNAAVRRSNRNTKSLRRHEALQSDECYGSSGSRSCQVSDASQKQSNLLSNARSESTDSSNELEAGEGSPGTGSEADSIKTFFKKHCDILCGASLFHLGNNSTTDIKGKVDLVITSLKSSPEPVLQGERLSCVIVEKMDELLSEKGVAVIFCDYQEFVALENQIKPFMTAGRLFCKPYPIVMLKRFGIWSHTHHLARSGSAQYSIENSTQLAFLMYRGDLARRMVENYQSRGLLVSGRSLTENVIETSETVDFQKARSKQASLILLKRAAVVLQELVLRFTTNVNDLVCDCFNGSLATALACMTMPNGENRRFVGCERTPDEIGKFEQHLMAGFAKQIISGLTMQRPSLRQQQTAQQILGAMSRKSHHDSIGKPSQDGPEKFCYLPDHLLSFLATVWRHSVQNLFQVSVAEWGDNDVAKLMSVDASMLLACDATHHHVEVRNSTIPGAGLGVFATTDLEKGEIVGWYHGKIVFEDSMGIVAKLHGMIGRGRLAISLDRFSTYALKVNCDIEDFDYKPRGNPLKTIYVVPLEFTVASYINDARQVEFMDVNTSRTHRLPNVGLVTNSDIELPDGICNPSLVQALTTRPIKKEAELFTSYGTRYWRDTRNNNL